MIVSTSVYIGGTGNPDTAFESLADGNQPYAVGDLGAGFYFGPRLYRKVQLDADANPTAPGQLLFWKDRGKYLVTNVADDALLPGAPAKEKAAAADKHKAPGPTGATGPSKASSLAGATGPGNVVPNPVPDSYRNNVAGLARGVVPPNSQFYVLMIGTNVPVMEAGAAVGGMKLVANAGTGADALGVAIGTASPFSELGTVCAATVDGLCMANFNVAE